MALVNFEHRSEIEELIAEIIGLNPTLGPVRMSTALQEVRNVLRNERDWLNLDALRVFVASTSRHIPEGDIKGLWEWLAASYAVVTRNRQTQQRVRPGDHSVALEDCLMEREGLCILVEGFKEGVIGAEEPGNAVQKALLQDWVSSF